MLWQHPQVNPDTIRVRFMGFGESSLEVEVFCHFPTTQLPEFLAIREDLLLRIMRIVAAAGVEFAIPSRSLYLSQDEANREQRRTAEAESNLPDTQSRLGAFERRTGT
jgi:MscS family membrane protein